MSKGSGNLSIWLSFSILLLSSGLVCHVMAIPIILDVSLRDSWLTVIVAAPLFLVWLLLLHIVMKGLHGQRLPDWLQREYGIIPAWLLRLLSIVILFFSGTYTLRDTSLWTVTTYMQQTPMIVVIVSAVALAMLAAYKGIRTIAMTSSILVPFVILLGYFIMGANTRYKDYSLLLPVLEHGWSPVFRGVVYVLAGLMEVWILLLYQHELRQRMKWWQLILLGLFLVGMTMGPTIGAITEFGPQEAAKQRHTAFEQWKILSLGIFLQHVDFLSIYQWLCGSFARIAISLYLIVDMADIRRPSRRLIALSIASVAMICGAKFSKLRDDQAIMYLQNIHLPGMFIFTSLLVAFLILAI
ncbi:endospore germination permease [Paenibacillus sp. J5C_2022]|uniref:endospore germination permease n=1 Tax=Paenibacillus sp. J5C2022 TaxID=2977129 RepID=UPI0021D26F35|nr:endospore germination permease [Paenibacillus sp. J5C2022]MCU6711264.1 endospore germination permease [Paenibacillus sp. J5C2022]